MLVSDWLVEDEAVDGHLVSDDPEYDMDHISPSITTRNINQLDNTDSDERSGQPSQHCSHLSSEHESYQ